MTSILWVLLLYGCSVDKPTPVLHQEADLADLIAPPAPQAPLLPDPTESRYGASHILIQWKGVAQSNEGTTRTRDEAKALASSIRNRAQSGEDFTDLARQYSEGPSGVRGGSLGVYNVGTMVPAFERGVASVKAGEIAPLIETPFGFHIARRDPVIEFYLAHILITHQGALGSSSTRAQESAQTRATEIYQKLENGGDFSKLAKEYSEDAAAREGGALGRTAPGRFVPVFERAAFALEVNQYSEVVHSPYGYHIILRTPDEA